MYAGSTTTAAVLGLCVAMFATYPIVMVAALEVIEEQWLSPLFRRLPGGDLSAAAVAAPPRVSEKVGETGGLLRPEPPQLQPPPPLAENVGTSTTTNSLAGELAALAALHNQGSLTEAEFSEAKAVALRSWQQHTATPTIAVAAAAATATAASSDDEKGGDGGQRTDSEGEEEDAAASRTAAAAAAAAIAAQVANPLVGSPQPTDSTGGRRSGRHSTWQQIWARRVCRLLVVASTGWARCERRRTPQPSSAPDAVLSSS